jgi:hypothetical protein
MYIANGFRQLSHCVHLSSWRACDWERGPFPPTSVIKKIRHAHYKLKTDRTSSSFPLRYTGYRPVRLPSASELSLTFPSSTPPSISRASRQSSTSPFHTLFTSSFPACRSSVSSSSPPPSSSNPTLTWLASISRSMRQGRGQSLGSMFEGLVRGGSIQLTDQDR